MDPTHLVVLTLTAVSAVLLILAAKRSRRNAPAAGQEMPSEKQEIPSGTVVSSSSEGKRRKHS
jgi:hypothetical protein